MASSNTQNQTILAAREGIAQRGESIWAIYIRRFRKHTLGKVGFIILLVLYLTALLADVFSPFSMTWTNKRKPFHPPVNLHLMYDGPEGRELRPWVYEQRQVNPAFNTYGVIPPRSMRIISIEVIPGRNGMRSVATQDTAFARKEQLLEDTWSYYELDRSGEVMSRLAGAVDQVERDPDPDARMRFAVGSRMVAGEEKALELWIVKGNKNFFGFFQEGIRYRVLGLFEARRHVLTSPTGGLFILGTDRLGRDIVSRLLHGARVSLTVGLIGAALTFMIGLLVGGIAGYAGGAVDNILMRLAEVIIAIPGLYLLLALRATFPSGLTSVQVYFLIIIILSAIGWATLARVIRGLVLSIKNEDYVMSSRTMGLSHLRVITKHILPNTLSYVIVQATLTIPGYILGESALSLLGLGITEPQSSWGLMLSAARQYRVVNQYPWILIPGFMIFLAILAWNFFGDGIRDAVDPRSRH
jgi:peptide/nickel transport system permease protein